MKTVMSIFLYPLIALGGLHGLTGNARVDLLSASVTDSVPQTSSIMVQNQIDDSRKKSSILGGAMSLLVPGSGEYYSERYVKGAVFFAVEVAVVTAAIVYNNKGNNKTNEFQNYANQHWSAVDYANWINQNSSHYEESGITYPTINTNTSQSDLFAQINAWEALPHQLGGDPGGFSHELPAYNTQQYYELIGKYSQFKYGWDTYVGPDGTRYGDDGYNVNYIPQQMKTYADNRGKANDYYYTASLAAGLIVVNHVLSALDGAWSASNYNKQFNSEVGLHLQDLGGGAVALTTELTVKVQL